MKENKWFPVFYNGLETNIEVTECGRVKRLKVDWMKNKTKSGEIDFTKLKLHKKNYQHIGIQIKGLKPKTVFVHQLVASAFHNYKFEGHKIVVDHIDSNTLNNHKDNLRIVTNRENTSKEKTIKSGLPIGVCFDKRASKYSSNIKIKGKTVFLGRFETLEEASNAYQKKLKTIIS